MELNLEYKRPQIQRIVTSICLNASQQMIELRIVYEYILYLEALRWNICNVMM